MDNALLQSVAKQLLNSTKIDLEGKISRVTRTSSQRLRTVTFEMDGRHYEAIEQNATKPSRWGQLARSSSSKMFRPTDLWQFQLMERSRSTNEAKASPEAPPTISDYLS
jgi:hypothetical protein